jgi:DNA-directed RNA polymerase subunit RPC12/RpoP
MGARVYRCSFCGHKFASFKEPMPRSSGHGAPEQPQAKPEPQIAAATAGK